MWQNELPPDRFDILLRVGGFVLIGFVALVAVAGTLAGVEDISRSALAVFGAGLAANFMMVRKFERGKWADFGLAWPPRNFLLGLALGAGILVALVLGAILAGLAAFAPTSPERSVVILAGLLLAGVFGEELLFRGYAFQYLVRTWNQPVTIVGSGILFGLVHLSNRNVQPLGAANTALWGCLLGYAYARTRSLWLPAGIHFGWNLALTLFTSNLSGTTIRATAWDLRWSASDLWSGGSYGLEGGLLATIAALPLFWLVRRWR